MKMLAVLCLLAVTGITASGQTASATLSGVVSDPSTAVIAGAVVQLTNNDTNVTLSILTNQAGVYSFASVPPGRYRISVKQSGFKESVMTDFVLHVGDTVSQNFTLQLGSTSESVTVSGEAVPVNTLDATVATVVERQVVENMPLNGRSFQGLITLSPGVATVTPNNSSTGQFVVNGQRSDTNYFTVDGVSANVGAAGTGGLGSGGTGAAPINSSTGGYNTLVSVDALQEFRISTSNFAPEFGRTPGGQISLVSRSGTNSFHGDVFDYFRNTVLDANDYFLKAKAKDRGTVQQNDFGGVIGGPVIKDRLFFFGSYEGLRLQAPSPGVKLVPTQAARNLAAAANSGGITGYMAQFANGFPLPDPGSAAAAPCTTSANCFANYTASFPGKSVLDTGSGRIDYRINSKMTLFGRYSHSPSSLNILNSADANVIDENTDSYTAGWTWVLTNTMNNDLRFNFTHTTFVLGQLPLYFKGTMSTIFPNGYAQQPNGYSIDNSAIQIRGLTTDGLLWSPNQGNSGNDGLNITDTFGWARGTHNFRFGADYRNLNPAFDQANFNQSNTFNATTTALPGFPSVANVCPASVLPAGAGSTVPGFICGQATASNLQHNYVQHFNIKQYSFFAQDTWRATKSLTITYGFRWEIDPAFTFTSNNPAFSIQRSSFSVTDISKIQINPFGSAVYPTTWRNISPRIGAAYQLSDNPEWGQVIRIGYGIFFDTGNQAGITLGNPFNARFNNTGAGANLPLVQYPTSLPNVSFVTPPAARLTLPVSQGGTDNVIAPDFGLPYVHQFNVTVEQQLGRKQTMSVGYVGALGRNLIGPLLFPANQANINTFAQINPTTGVATADAVNIIGNYASSDYHALQAKFQRQFYKGFSALVSYTWAHSLDDSSISGALGTTTLPNATQLSAGRPLALLRANSDFDVRHLLAFSIVYDIPNPANRTLRAIFGHWSVDPIYHYQSALPIDILSGTTGSLGGTAYGERPNLIPGVPVFVSGSDRVAQYRSLQGVNGCPGGQALNVAPVSADAAASAGCVAPTTGATANAKGAFCTPAPIGGQPISGNLGRNAVRGFSLQEFDFSLHREFVIRESIRLRFQADMFNVFNLPSFGAPGATLNLAAFGVTSSMANSSLGSNNSQGAGFNPVFNTGGPRNVQFAVKLFF